MSPPGKRFSTWRAAAVADEPEPGGPVVAAPDHVDRRPDSAAYRLYELTNGAMNGASSRDSCHHARHELAAPLASP